MSTPSMMREFADKTRGRALEIKGRITGRRGTRAHGELVQGRGETRELGRRLTGRLRRAAHR